MSTKLQEKYRGIGWFIAIILFFIVISSFGLVYALDRYREDEAVRLKRAEKERAASEWNERNTCAQIEGVLQLQSMDWNRGDLDGFMAGYWDSPDLEFVSTNTTKGFGPTKERYFKRYKAEGKEMGTLTFSDIAVSLNAEQEATATGKWKVVMSKESPSGGFTLTLRKFETGWKIVKDVTTSDEPPKK